MRDGRRVGTVGGAAAIALVVAGLSAASPSAARANDLRVETGAVERVSGTVALRVPAKVSWKNAWRNAKNHDAVWLFVKVRSGPNAGWRHARLLPTSHGASTPIACETSADKVGIFCQPAGTHRGDLSGDVVLEIDPSSLPENMRSSANLEARVHGLEMVYVPDGPFSIGELVKRCDLYRRLCHFEYRESA